MRSSDDSNQKGSWKDRLKLGETFDSFQDMKQVIIEHGVQCERMIFTYKKDSERFLAHCNVNRTSIAEENRCSWRVRAIERKKTKVITITQACLVHTCEAADHWKRRMHSNSDHLANKIFDIIMRNRCTRPSSIRDTAQALIHPDIQYHTAYAAKKKALERLDGKEKDSFFLIPDHCHHILDRDPTATAKWAAPDGKFESLFVCPGGAKDSYKHCRPLVAFDGTFTRSSYPQILLIATALDANDTIVMLAYCMVPSENPTEWFKFLRLLRDAIPKLEDPGTAFISDREKGLLSGVEEIFPFGHHAYCTWHLGDNIRSHFGKKSQKDLEPLVYATIVEQFQRRLDRIKQKNKPLADYIERTAIPEHYSRAFCPVKRWGHETSQQAESLNRALKPQRQEVAFRQSNLLWDYMMMKHYEKAQIAAKTTTPFPPNIMKKLRHTEEKALQLIADASSNIECRVTDFMGRQFLVKFEPEWFCSCGDWQDIQLPCVHAWRACTKLHRRHFDYVSPYYSTTAYQQTYSASIPTILHENLVPNPNCGEPIIRRKRGRPSEKARLRFEDQEPVRRPRRCSHCKELGHDRRKCPVRDTELSQARGRGPTIESDEEDRIEEAIQARGKEQVAIGTESDSSDDGYSSSETQEIDEEFTAEAIAARKDDYHSEEEVEIPTLRAEQEMFDISQSAPIIDLSQPGFYTNLVSSVLGK